MKNIILVLIGLCLFQYSGLTQGFVEQFRSPEDRRPPAGFSVDISGVNWRVNDMNNDGVRDIFTRRNDSLIARDGISKKVIVGWKVEEGASIHRGFYRFHDNAESIGATHRLGIMEETGIKFIIELETNEMVWSMENADLLGVADFNGNGFPEIMFYDKINKQAVLIGWEKDNLQSGKIESTLIVDVTAVPEYTLSLKFESESKRRFVNSISGRDVASKHDLNGDGEPEIVTFILDDNDAPIGMVIRNGKSKDIIWNYMYPAEHLDELQREFHGFHDANGDDLPEAIFGHRTVVTMDKNVHSLDQNFEIVKVLDLNNDGYAELIGRGLVDSTVQVWGKSESSAISQVDLKEMGFRLLPNYPNPFTTTTQIPFELEEAAEVSIDIYDAQGRFVENLLRGYYPAGQHQVEWSWANDNRMSGLYFCRMKIGGQSHTQILVQQ